MCNLCSFVNEGGKIMNKFSDAKNKFDSIYSSLNKLDISFVPVDGKIRNDLEIKNSKNQEEAECRKK